MTIQDMRIDIMSRGIFINEGKLPDGGITVNLVKFDTDGLRLEANFRVSEESYIDDTIYSTLLRKKTTLIDKWILERHDQDINSCPHEPVMIGNRKACSLCMGNFGDRIVLDINKN
jgi:hypothetical protein